MLSPCLLYPDSENQTLCNNSDVNTIYLSLKKPFIFLGVFLVFKIWYFSARKVPKALGDCEFPPTPFKMLFFRGKYPIIVVMETLKICFAPSNV